MSCFFQVLPGDLGKLADSLAARAHPAGTGTGCPCRRLQSASPAVGHPNGPGAWGMSESGHVQLLSRRRVKQPILDNALRLFPQGRVSRLHRGDASHVPGGAYRTAAIIARETAPSDFNRDRRRLAEFSTGPAGRGSRIGAAS